MTKQEYMDKLAKALEVKVPDMKDEVLEDYEAHFAMAMSEGKSEEEVCEDLGDIDEFVSEFASMEEKRNSANKGSQSEKTERNGSKHEYYTYNADDTEFDGRIFANTLSGLGKGISEMVDGIVNSAMSFAKAHPSNCDDESFDEDFVEGEYMEEDGEDSVLSTADNEGKANKLIVEADMADVVIGVSNDDLIHVHYENDGTLKQQLRYRFFFKEENGTIRTGVRRAYTKSGYMRMHYSGEAIRLSIKVPKGMESIKIGSACGDIDAKDIDSGEVAISSASGDIRYSGKANSVNFNSCSGDIRCKVDKKFEGAFNSVSGDIQLVASDGLKAHMNTTSGDIKVECSGNSNVSMNTTSGDLVTKLNNSEGFALKYNTLSGDVIVECENERRSFPKAGKVKHGNGGTVVAANTVSGDIRLIS